MKLPRLTVFCLLAALMALSIALRYPTTSHETGVDSYFIHNLTSSITREGNAKWILNPLSLFGFFPMSYPSAGPFLLAGLSELSAMDVETTILISSLGFGAAGVVVSFSLAREFRDDDIFCLSVCFLYTLAPRFLAFTLWTASMRGLFMVVLPVVVLIALRTYRAPSGRNLLVLILTIGVLSAVHRLGILIMLVVVIASILAFIIAFILRILRARVPSVFLHPRYRRGSSYIALVAVAGITGIMLLGTNLLDNYSEGQLATGASFEVEMLNLGVSIGRSVGASLALAIPGLLILLKSRNKALRDVFLAVAFLGLVPTLFLRVYTGFYILPFMALLGGLTLLWMSQLRNRTLRRSALSICVIIVVVLSSGILQYEKDNITTMSEGTYSTATYLAAIHSPGIITNDGLLGVRVASVSGCPYLPVGGAGTTSQGPELLIYGYFSPQEIYQNLTRVPLASLTLDSDSPWVVGSIQAEADWVKIMETPYTHPPAGAATYNPILFVQNRHLGLTFTAYGNIYQSAFAESVHSQAYLFYESADESIYFIGLP